MRPTRFSIVIPCYNEKEDVRLSIESALAQDWSEKEIIVVDDSTDETTAVVNGYADRGVQVIRPPMRRGCCEARNVGLQAARGDIVVFLNADVHAEPDLLKHLANLYEQGSDCVVLRSVVSNTTDMAGRHIQAEAELMYEREGDRLCWSEAFSFRREAGTAVGGIPGPFPMPFCRDWYFGALLTQKGYTKRVDLSYDVPHRAPGTTREYFRQKTRDGRFGIGCLHFMEGWSLGPLLARMIAKQLVLLLLALLILPGVIRALQLSRRSRRGLADVPPFLICRILYRFGYSIGEWVGWIRLARLRPSARMVEAQVEARGRLG